MISDAADGGQTRNGGRVMLIIRGATGVAHRGRSQGERVLPPPPSGGELEMNTSLNMRRWRAKSHGLPSCAAAIAAGALLAGCLVDGGGGESFNVNVKPSFAGTATKTTYDGVSDDLLTAGLGKTGLAGAAAPAHANATAPTVAELRRMAIFNNYRAILDINAKGGYGTLYGPNIDINGADTLGEGKIAGTEYLAYADDGTGKQNVTLMVQVPASFNKDRPCIVTATSSGSRGVYGAIGSAGEWGLKQGCAVAYTDKGTGMGIHDLATNTVNLQNGTRADAATAGKSSNFTANLTAAELTAYNAACRRASGAGDRSQPLRGVEGEGSSDGVDNGHPGREIARHPARSRVAT